MTNRVLIVDDEVNVLNTLRRALRGEPYTVVTAQSAEEGLALLETEPFQVVLSDEKMPGMSGTTFLSLLKQRHPDTIRIMLTGHATLSAAMNAVNEGEIYRFFSKPWDDLALKFAIRSALEKYDFEVKNRALLAAIPDVMIRTDREGTCLDYHAAVEPAFPAGTLLGRRLGDVLSPPLAEEASWHMREALATGRIQLFEFPFQLSGGTRHFEARMVPSGPEEVLTIVRDITERYDALAAIRREQEKLEELNRTLEARVQEELAKSREKDRVLAHQGRLAAMGEMVGAIAHQWRQPLTAAASLVQNIKAVSEAGMLTPGYLAVTVDSTLRLMRFMSETIDEFRSYFRPDKETEQFDLREVVEQALRIARPQLDSLGIRTRFAAGAESCPVNGFPNEFKQVVLNLINNACQAIQERVPLPGRELPPGRIELYIDHERGRERLTIGDNGCGIEEGVRDRIFEPYFTTRAERGGTGIGLYMSKMIIESSMGGRLYLQQGGAMTRMVIEMSGVEA